MEEPKYNVIVSDRARQMLGQQIRFMATISTSAAQKTQKSLVEAMRSLETMPGRFPFLDEDYLPKNKYHKMFVEKWYLVLYQIRDNNVYVDWVVDCRQDYQWLLR